MEGFFSIIYIGSNRFNEEQIAIGIIANLNGIPCFSISDRKLNFAIHGMSADMKAAIRKGFRLMDFDVNKIKRGEETLSLFDPPYAKKLLSELSVNKKGVIRYSQLYEARFAKDFVFEELFKKIIGEQLVENLKPVKKASFKQIFREFANESRFDSFTRGFKMRADSFPIIYSDATIDLLRKSNFYTVFYTIDFTSSRITIQNNLAKFRTIITSLQLVSQAEGMGKGRYYLVYENASIKLNQELIEMVKIEKQSGFELIRMSEVKDKI